MLDSLSSEELQFIKAIELYKKENSKLFLSWTEVLKIFKELGYHYYGPFDGHDVHELIHLLEDVKKVSGPVLLHLITEKGKGLPCDEMTPEAIHAQKAGADEALEAVVEQRLVAPIDDREPRLPGGRQRVEQQLRRRRRHPPHHHFQPESIDDLPALGVDHRQSIGTPQQQVTRIGAMGCVGEEAITRQSGRGGECLEPLLRGIESCQSVTRGDP